jgi:hypothetical protein
MVGRVDRGIAAYPVCFSQLTLRESPDVGYTLRFMSRVYEALQRTALEQPAAAQVAAESVVARRVSGINDTDAERLLLSASLQVDTSSMAVRRYMPVELYIVGADLAQATQLQDRVSEWLATVGMLTVRDIDWQSGSWRARSLYRTNGRLTAEDLMLVQTLLKVTIEDSFTSTGVPVRRKQYSQRDELEEAKVRSEILKNRATAFKAVGDAAISLAKAILTASVGVSILIGTFRISKIEVPALSVPKIVIESSSGKQAVEEWSASKSAAASQMSRER